MNQSEYIPSKQKSKKLKTAKADEKPAIPKDLTEKWGAVEACATTYEIIENANLPYRYRSVIEASLKFMRSLYQNCLDEAMKHPDADLIPELKAEKEKAAKDGKAQ